MPQTRLLQLDLDTSVYGGCFDAEFELESNRLIERIRDGLAIVILSELVIQELAHSPPNVRALANSLSPELRIFVPLGEDATSLRDRYVAAGIVRARSRNDATHVALATVAGADALVSWSFKDIVRLDKMRGYNEINVASGYSHLQIVSPQEVGFDDP